ncbi:tetratricopeptide repeat protein [Caldimonas thermodepolymerans]|jgi:Flp pilus assembly protein TadD, contains TPR repeats|uniref:tetratricopeptide repeat protein n=1 Tax=Caldimonas thermodepolymerans TaxID=215580 RepID=UPI002490DAA7|nr:tetratricopeptide repeat protein [Caldimonas thermodepolymerans]
MPSAVSSFRLLMLAASLAGGSWAVAAEAPAASGAPVRAPVESSGLDAPLFYQLLVGEMELRAGNAAAAYEILLDGARKTGDERLFRRAVEIALQARAGDQALAAAQAWRTAVPGSVEAHRFAAQLLVGLNRVAEALDPLRALLANTPAAERPETIATLPRFFVRPADRKTMAGVLEQALQPYATMPETRLATLLANARMRLQAEEPDRALALAQEAAKLDPSAEGVALLALELMPQRAQAESIVRDFLQAKPASAAIRLSYVRTLVNQQRYPEAAVQLETATQVDPALAPAWLSLGALRLELKQPREAEQALRRYLELAEGRSESTQPTSTPTEDGSIEVVTASPAEGVTQAYLLLAQAAEAQGQYEQADQWLSRIDEADRALSVQLRRAMLLARQGRTGEARELLRKVPERSPQDARAKVLAESQLLRELKDWGEAYQVLAAGATRFPDDVDLLYEQAMMAEKLRRVDEMERLLRRVIELKPDHYHAYNALGYTLADRNVRLEEARQLVQKALEFAPNEPFIIDSMGWVEYRMGRPEEALKHLQRAYQARPDAEIGAHLGEVLWSLGRHDEARRVWRDARERDGSNEVLIETLARLKVQL